MRGQPVLIERGMNEGGGGGGWQGRVSNDDESRDSSPQEGEGQ